MAAVVEDILPNARQQAHPHQGLIGCDRIGDPEKSRWVEMKRARHFFADEGVIVDFRETLVDENVSHLVLELSRGVARRH